jgi:DNA repair exonuclease SbcCD nuclease subunit
MLRLLHLADVHLGARHADLGEAAAAQRERQFAAFRAAVELAIAEKVDVVLIAGDLFDSNTQPRRSVERVAEELRRLAAARIRTVIIPGTHDCYDRSSIYRTYDLGAMAGVEPDDDLVTVLTPDRPSVRLVACDAEVHATVFASKRAEHSPLRDLRVGAAARAATAAEPEGASAGTATARAASAASRKTAAAADDDSATWHIGLVHGSIAIPDRTDADEVVVTKEEIAATGLDYLALGHWHSAQQGRAGSTTYAYSGAPEPVAVNQDGAGNVLLVELDEVGGKRAVRIEERRIGKTRFEKLDIDAATLASQPELVGKLAALADADLVLDVRITGVRPDELDVDPVEVEEQLKGSFLRARVRDTSLPGLSEGPLPSADTIAGAFIRNVEARIAELEADPDGAAAADAAELRDVLRLGRLLLAGHEVTL